MLIVAAPITLDRSTTPPTATGGTLRVCHPWLATPTNLTPISYRHRGE
ncbi:hypothetical protein UO65_3452 [Actinokineospora spheciospongiae]|uniref:Uncharacterized protein n=2 Tax=Actinokineospora spheciospongiae TaxID=909613 RepID=W7IK89_9PSEU|nr:hypothetical protein UO65_3452 [Actinokineospora spheciospongiae]